MTKSDPNTGGSVVTYIFELGLIGDPEICKNFIEEAGIYTHGCDAVSYTHLTLPTIVSV